ncbi:MAG: DUF86 domain-containing protein [Candidatus Omnitrophica bacterium]|nr:DUF86 domain-containing protein [Candidatus Omnitrophota bacterium]MBU1128909.1 DUF86 domain-containing protein [Candidatus Omnitrophota bacterium]MBU1784199.1 DUF86 domain-containing protein [Candidatus Omnitrophota bacterium]MBU1852034.1 DUF86 domain-containing protein [Candidatus Omnitrophota bacterium]
MVDKNIIATRISRIKEATELLSFIKEVDRGKFAGDPDLFLKAERLVEIIVQSMIDIGSHIIASESLKKPENYGEIFEVLAQNSIIDDTLMMKVKLLAGLRNILAHDYLETDHGQLFDNLNLHMGDFMEFCSQIAGYISDRAK